MPIQPCPACGAKTPRHMDEASRDAFVYYYRCDNCGHVWTINKQDPSRVTHVTPLPDAKPKP